MTLPLLVGALLVAPAPPAGPPTAQEQKLFAGYPERRGPAILMPIAETHDAADRAEIGQRPSRLNPEVVAPLPAVDDESAQHAPTDDDGWNAYRATAWVSVAVTAGLLGVAAYSGAAAASSKDDVNRLLTYRDEKTGAPLEYGVVARRFEQSVRDGEGHDRRAKLMLLLAGGTAVVATTAFILDKTRRSAPELALFPDGARVGVFGSWRWRF